MILKIIYDNSKVVSISESDKDKDKELPKGYIKYGSGNRHWGEIIMYIDTDKIKEGDKRFKSFFSEWYRDVIFSSIESYKRELLINELLD